MTTGQECKSFASFPNMDDTAILYHDGQSQSSRYPLLGYLISVGSSILQQGACRPISVTTTQSSLFFGLSWSTSVADVHDLQCNHETSLQLRPSSTPLSVAVYLPGFRAGRQSERTRGVGILNRKEYISPKYRECVPPGGMGHQNEGLFQEVTWVRTFPIAGHAISACSRMQNCYLLTLWLQVMWQCACIPPSLGLWRVGCGLE